MDQGNYVVKDDLDPRLEDDANEIFHRVNTGWAMWKKAVNFTVNEAKASVIEGFVLVEKSKLLQILGSAVAIGIKPKTKTNLLESDFIVREVKAMLEAQEPSND